MQLHISRKDTTFWTSGTGLSGSPFDPRVVYDSLSSRWIAVVDADGGLATSKVWFAISATSDPTGTWAFFGFTADGTGATWADFPGFGVNSTWIMITNNMFTVAATPSFVGAKAWVIDKTTALAGGRSPRWCWRRRSTPWGAATGSRCNRRSPSTPRSRRFISSTTQDFPPGGRNC